MTTMTDPVIPALQDTANWTMALHVVAHPEPTRTDEAKLDGMASIACDALHIGMTPFGVRLAVCEAVLVRPHPNRTELGYTLLRDRWNSGIVNDVRATLGQPRGGER